MNETAKQLGFALIVTSVGAGLMILMPLRPDGLRVPLWVAEAAVSTFLWAGLSLASRALGWWRLADVLSILVVAGLAVPGFWIMLSPEQQTCTRSLSIPFFQQTGTASDLECRIVFGSGAVITLIFGVVMGYMIFRRKR